MAHESAEAYVDRLVEGAQDARRPRRSEKGLRRDSKPQRTSRSRFGPEQPVRRPERAIRAGFSARFADHGL